MPEDYLSNLVRRAKSRSKWREDRRTAERTLGKRRERYANDSDYAESIKESVRRQREQKDKSDRKRSFNRDKVIVIDGVSVTLLSSGKAAKLIGVSPRTLENWETKGYIPVNRAKDALGRRWYPAEFVMFLFHHASRRKGHRLDAWANRVKDAWRENQLSDRRMPIVSDHLEDHNVNQSRPGNSSGP
jgi:DNA-binding transcriptional regulator YiaG